MTEQRKPTLTICRGLPASGKTTWARTVVGQALGDLDKLSGPEAQRVCRVNRDDLRAMLHNGSFIPGVTEELVLAVRNVIVKSALQHGWDVISDDTNLRARNVKELMRVAKKMGAEVGFKDFTDVPVQECIDRDFQRGLKGGVFVGEDVISDMHTRFLRGKKLPLPIPDLGDEASSVFKPIEQHGDELAQIVDIDGTIAHNDGHRSFYDYTRVLGDKPKPGVIRVVQNNIRMGMATMFVSGRKDTCRKDTAKWIWEHVMKPIYPSNSSDEDRLIWLFMRRADDDRDDAIVKYEIYRDFIAPKFDVQIVFDDRNRVVDMWRQIGLTCAQVQDGDF